MITLNENRVLITAGASGIGYAMAEAFTEAGASVWVTDVDSSAIAGCPNSWRTSEVDAADEAGVKQLFGEIESTWGRLDTLCANAGIAGPTASVEDIDLSDWQRCVSVNLEGAFLASKYAIPIMKRQNTGAIVITSSTRAFSPIPSAPLMWRPNGLSSDSRRPWRWSSDPTTSAPTPFARAPSMERGWMVSSTEKRPQKGSARRSFGRATHRAPPWALFSSQAKSRTWPCSWHPRRRGMYPVRQSRWMGILSTPTHRFRARQHAESLALPHQLEPSAPDPFLAAGRGGRSQRFYRLQPHVVTDLFSLVRRGLRSSQIRGAGVGRLV